MIALLFEIVCCIEISFIVELIFMINKNRIENNEAIDQILERQAIMAEFDKRVN